MRANVELRSRQTLWLATGLLVLVVASGCQNMVDQVPPPKQFKGPAQQAPHLTANAGVSVAAGTETLIDQQVIAYKANPRHDPFALAQVEQQHEVKENNERIFATTGSFFGQLFVPKPESVQIEQTEPQPFRRLAGILVGDSVMAIIDMGDGSPMQVIRPGMQIPNSPWKVVSIDSDKAVLRRSGNIKPREVVVRLQSPAFNSGPTGQPGQPGQNQNPGQQQPPGRNPGRFGGGGGGGGIN